MTVHDKLKKKQSVKSSGSLKSRRRPKRRKKDEMMITALAQLQPPLRRIRNAARERSRRRQQRQMLRDDGTPNRLNNPADLNKNGDHRHLRAMAMRRPLDDPRNLNVNASDMLSSVFINLHRTLKVHHRQRKPECGVTEQANSELRLLFWASMEENCDFTKLTVLSSRCLQRGCLQKICNTWRSG